MRRTSDDSSTGWKTPRSSDATRSSARTVLARNGGISWVPSPLHEARAGTPSNDAFSALFSVLDLDCRKRALLRRAADRAERLGSDVTAIDGVVLALTRKPALVRARVVPSGTKQSVR